MTALPAAPASAFDMADAVPATAIHDGAASVYLHNLHLLADRNGVPAALLLAASGTPDDSVPALLALAARLPCFYGAALTLPPAWTDAGWQALPDSELWRCDGVFHPQDVASDPAVRWIDGDWPLVPPAKPVGAQAASRALALQLVQLVAADADTHAIEALLRRDPALSYHLLKLVNSLGIHAGRRITSFAQAILLLGRQQLRRWLNLMLFSAGDGDVRSAMLLARVAARARALELLAREAGMDRHGQEQAFMTGMFSLLGALFGMPLADVLAPLTLTDAVKAALLERRGELGALLALLDTANGDDFAALAVQLRDLQIAPAAFNGAIAEAGLWMLDVTSGQPDAGHHD